MFIVRILLEAKHRGEGERGVKVMMKKQVMLQNWVADVFFFSFYLFEAIFNADAPKMGYIQIATSSSGAFAASVD